MPVSNRATRTIYHFLSKRRQLKQRIGIGLPAQTPPWSGSWTDDYPDGSKIQANTLHTVLQNAKLLIRKRAICNNGTFDEHSFFGLTADGTHPISKVGWCKVHTTTAGLTAFTPKNPGSLHFDLQANKLYVIDSDSGLQQITTKNHDDLSHLNVNADHTQYYLKNNTRPIGSEIHMLSSTALVVSKFNSNAGSVLPATHRTLSWVDAHPAPEAAIVARHFASASVRLLSLDVTSSVLLERTTGHVDVPVGSHYFWPVGTDTSYTMMVANGTFYCGGWPSGPTDLHAGRLN